MRSTSGERNLNSTREKHKYESNLAERHSIQIPHTEIRLRLRNLRIFVSKADLLSWTCLVLFNRVAIYHFQLKFLNKSKTLKRQRLVQMQIRLPRCSHHVLSLRSDYYCLWLSSSLRKQPTFGYATTAFPAKWRLRNERRNSTPMTRHYPDLGSASDWSCPRRKCDSINQKRYSDLGSDAPSVWNFCAGFSDVSWRGNQ